MPRPDILARVPANALDELEAYDASDPEPEPEATAAPKLVSLIDENFPEQAAYIRDPARLKAIISTRRGGKSIAWAIEVLEDAREHAGANYLYIGLTKDSARKAIWKDGFKMLDARFGLGIKFNETKSEAHFPNGAVLYILGLDSTEEQQEKARGGKYRKILIDEAQSFTIDLSELINGPLRAATTDDRGTITVAGTPGVLRSGIFFDLTHDQDPGKPGRWTRDHMATAGRWSGHRWAAEHNPHVREQVLEENASMIAVNPLIVETPAFQRERQGRWVLDDSKLVYRFNPRRNSYGGKLPEHIGRWHHVLVVDLGFSDSSSFTVHGYHDHDTTLHVRRSYKRPGMDITAVAEEAKRLDAIYDFDEWVVDGANKQAVEEMINRHNIPWQAADKTGKADFIELLNAELILGTIKFSTATCEACHGATLKPPCNECGGTRTACGQLVEELGKLVWDDRTDKREEHPSCENHCADGLLYGWRRCYQYLSKAPPKKPKIGSPEWHAQEEQRMLEHAEREALASVEEFNE